MSRFHQKYDDKDDLDSTQQQFGQSGQQFSGQQFGQSNDLSGSMDDPLMNQDTSGMQDHKMGMQDHKMGKQNFDMDKAQMRGSGRMGGSTMNQYDDDGEDI